MLESQKHVFWQAFLVTIWIFGIGIFSGIILENWRTTKLEKIYVNSEINLLDIKLQSDIYSTGKYNCDKAIEENVKFADRIYEEAKNLERFQKATVLTEELKLSHQKYDLLRINLWMNSILLKEKCNATYYETVYFYNYFNNSFDLSAKEAVFSKLLEEIKERKGWDMLLIPIAADTNLTSVDIIMDKYNITKSEIPVILINREIKITELKNINEIIKFFEKPKNEIKIINSTKDNKKV